MFDYTPGLGHGNIFEPHKRYRAPHFEQRKIEGERMILAFSPNLTKEGKYGRFLEWSSITYGTTPPNMCSLYPSGHWISAIKVW